jgi:hypothetical protein
MSTKVDNSHGISGWQAFSVIATCVVVMAVILTLAPQ